MTAGLSTSVCGELIGADGVPQSREVGSIMRGVAGARFEDFGLTLDEGKQIHQSSLKGPDTALRSDVRVFGLFAAVTPQGSGAA